MYNFKKVTKTLCAVALAGSAMLSMAVPAFANDHNIVGGYTVVHEHDAVVDTGVEGTITFLGRNQVVQSGNLRGRWEHGNFGLNNLFSQVTGNSETHTGHRAQGLGTARNGNGQTTGRHDGRRAPGTPSRSETSRTVLGGNTAMWNLQP